MDEIFDDEDAFAEAAGRHRRELHVHCYRMLGNFEEAEDLVQETLLRAWRGRAGFDRAAPSANLRAWLYRIATNACLDVLRGSSRRLTSYGSFAEVPWLQPYPDRLLGEISPDEPDAAVVARETVELAYIAVIQLLPPRQRAVLLLRDVLGWPAAQVADQLGMTVASANSALQRARATLKENAPRRDEASAAWEPTEVERRLLNGFIDSHQSGDFAAAVALMHEDIRITMPPLPLCYDGRGAITPLLERARAMGEWRLLPSGANRRPAALSYLRRPGDTEFRASKIDVIRVADGLIREVTTFDARFFAAFGMPEVLAGS
ncbi:RNA polymerase sigma factor [Microtetraspora sp. NBRC 13810]|uniref:RNA polymerase subunit sigma-70 n=1 Tax=Microtetraspora sp. NBRC 13810 TaxID=3030990 RepID=UPI0024A3D4D0|nr:RNA polymerase subunit sigma-70 [Microtetraspora sp. NBRC 13810]GLW09810.1 RNA polymerase sigma factor [Microtetraspora sp. NBRC 13810]